MKKWKKYLKRISSYFILLMLAIGLVQCSLIFIDTHIRPEKPPYFKIGDTLVYKSDRNVDSFYVDNARLYAIGESLDSLADSNWDYERFVTSIIQIDCTDSCYKFTSKITPSEYWVAVYGIEPSSFTLEDYDRHFAHLTLQIGKYQLEDLYKDYNIHPDSITGKEIRDVYYSKKYGVVEYELTNGEVFDLDEACITMMEERH